MYTAPQMLCDLHWSMDIMRKPYKTPEYGQDGRMSLQRNNFGGNNMVVLSRRTTRKWIYLETL